MASVLFLVIAFGGIQGVYLRDTLMIVLAALLSLWTWWYFYRKESVTQYFNPGLRAGEDRQFQSAVSEELDRTLGREVKDA